MVDKDLLALVEKASKEKDQQAFVELCTRKAREVIFLCVREMGNPHDGEDAAQEVFIRMQKSIQQLKAPEAFNVWLNRLVYTTCLNMKRDSMKHKDALQAESFDDSLLDDSHIALPQEYVEDADKRRMIANLIDELPDKYRTCILLHYYQHLSYAEISEVLDIPYDTVNNNMRMARKVLKLELENALGQEEGESKAWGAVPLVALGPALSVSLQDSALSTVTADIVEKCLAVVGISSAAIAAAGGVAAGGAAVAGSSAVAGTAAVAAGTVAKTVATIAATAAIVLGGGSAAVVAINEARPLTPPPAISQTIETPGQQTSSDTAAPAVAQAGEVALSGLVYLASPEGSASASALNGLAGIELQLVQADNSDAVVQTLTTQQGDLQGQYSFADVPEGRYRLLIQLPEKGSAVDNGVTSVETAFFNRQSGTVVWDGSDVFTVTPGQGLSGIDIALQIPSELHGRIGLYSGGQEIAYDDGLLPGVFMHLYDPQGELVAVTTISDDGYYQFENPMISQTGSYTLHVEVEEDAEISLEVDDVQVDLYPGYGS
ncbi:sigma-70 family RNA polymerase sigma factor [Ruminococcaceae bacterium OttesenSCG-928-I18]|nr:sigma-70 family RNA polymerase sigma factor [Ruminococcaceae bacterium OttesenSCG-928-I18]